MVEYVAIWMEWFAWLFTTHNGAEIYRRETIDYRSISAASEWTTKTILLCRTVAGTIEPLTVFERQMCVRYHNNKNLQHIWHRRRNDNKRFDYVLFMRKKCLQQKGGNCARVNWTMRNWPDILRFCSNNSLCCGWLIDFLVDRWIWRKCQT